ncbi:MAG: hypothetical protein ACRC0B_08070 [Legionella sp.]
MKEFIIVLQGEYAVVNGSEMNIVTSKATTCTVLIAREKKSNLIGLIHIDCYTAAADITQKLFDDFQQKLQNLNIENPEYDIRYAKGLSKDQTIAEQKVTQMQVVEIVRVSKNYVKTIGTLNLSLVEENRHPFEFTIEKNEITLNMLTLETNLYTIVEHLQGMEYGDFNKFLNRCFGKNDPHFFLGKEASRFNADLPDITNLMTLKKTKTFETRLELLLNPIVRFERTAEVSSITLNKLNELIHTCDITLREKELFSETVTKKQYNLILRQTAAKKDYLPILQFLVTNSLEFGLDFTSCGQKSGTAIDVARVRGNDSALTKLSLFKQEQQKNSDEMEQRQLLMFNSPTCP